MRNRSRCLSPALLAIALVLLPSQLAAQDYPKKQIELVVPFVAGGTTDNIARLIAQRFTESWSQTVIVNNRPGGGSTIGHHVVAKAPRRRPYAARHHHQLRHHRRRAETAVRPDQGFRPDHRACLAPAHPGGASVVAGDEREGVHRAGAARSRAGGTSRLPAPAPRRTSPPRCSSPWPASIWCTCRTRATPRP